MKFSGFWQTFTGLTVGFLLYNIISPPPVLAGRYVLNQTPQKIEGYFGGYITKKTQGEQVTYTYAPKSFRRLFPQFPKSNFSITFIRNQAKYIVLNFNGSFDQYPGSYNYGKVEAAKFYNYISGYQPPIWQELSAKFGGNETVYLYEFCLGDGVATSFETYGYKQFTDSATLAYNTRCEPSYYRTPN